MEDDEETCKTQFECSFKRTLESSLSHEQHPHNGGRPSLRFGSRMAIANKVTILPGLLVDALWRQDGTEEFDSISAAVVGDDASILLAGYSSGNWSGNARGQADFVAVNLDADGNELWRWQVFQPKYIVLAEVISR